MKKNSLRSSLNSEKHSKFSFLTYSILHNMSLNDERNTLTYNQIKKELFIKMLIVLFYTLIDDCAFLNILPNFSLAFVSVLSV
jgi:hypothetical protein